MSDKQKEYFQDWWKKHGDDINARRRERYHSDPKYRRKARRWARETQRRRSKYTRQFILPKVYWSFSERRPYFSSGVLVREARFPSWSDYDRFRKLGIVPLPLQYDSRGWHLYTAAQIMAAQYIGEERGWDELYSQEIGDYLRGHWYDEDEEWEPDFQEWEDAQNHPTVRARQGASSRSGRGRASTG